LAPEAYQAFQVYANARGLHQSELAKLLLVRERVLRRIVRAGKHRAAEKPPRQKYGEARRRPTVTAHLSSWDEVESFKRYAQGCGMSVQRCGAWLLETELAEKWLERVILLP
jgi:hypothetical protein